MVKRMLVLAVMAVCGLLASVDRASAGCTVNLADCYVRAAKVDPVWYRWANGLDCELDFVDCARRKIIGA